MALSLIVDVDLVTPCGPVGRYLSGEHTAFIFRAEVIEWLALLLRIRKVPGSNLFPKTGYSDIFCGFLQCFQTNDGILS
jgi:hypothetical protein